MAEAVRGVNLLQSELEKARESLRGVDENIKKLTGRDPTAPNFRPQRRVSLGSSDRGDGRPGVAESRLFNLARRGIVQDDPGSRRKPGGAFARLGPRPGGRARDRRQDSGDEEETTDRPTLQSSVVATPRDERSRLSSIEEQAKDRKGQARNRRMFGLLLGTLQKFKDESLESKKKEEQRIEIENKLEQKFKQEKEEIIQERRQLFLERRRKQFRIKLIEQKMEMAQNHENWEKETRKLENFILTKTKPHIFYMPKILTDDSEEKLNDTKLAVDEMIESRQKKLEEEIKDMMSQVHDDEAQGHSDDGGESGAEEDHEESDNEKVHGDEKENRERKRHESDSREILLSEREQRDKEREQRDRDRRMKDKHREERKREHSGRNKDREGSRSREREREKRRVKSRSRSRERRHSEKSRSGKKRRHDDDGSKSRRRSKDEGKAEKTTKVWEPMEDEEEEEEFVGTETKSSNKETASIQNKMLEMAGMGEQVGEVEDEEKDWDRENGERMKEGGDRSEKVGNDQVGNMDEEGSTG